ncbi:hypothetical protein S7711_05360 [Stachybotrys chartarum IBT 7711]|uniref:alpha-1,2-Mannosidase n=1 Tax=Stachybotrys chartarum (strain CBS 109288 / IBT 7711) TaxID=1280523 RepID=A0A084B981_STACB|nr:hypothetical protein S7711_05360 [Stachybotrys chartarum IBT 7711]KFA78138.1 hypothetical protein S40288_01370 [Stachybotrys chartarum IBT 40288]
MIRDPFDIHRKKAFGNTAFRAAQSVKETVVQAGTDALDMSFSVPRNLPNFNAAERELEDRAWSSISGSRSTKSKGIMNEVQGRVTGLFDKNALPMYKDKPYLYAPSMRRRPWWRRKRILLSGALGFLYLLHLLGVFSSGSTSANDESRKAGWLWDSAGREKGKHDWNKRRELVVEAFQLSWDAYERYAWGYDEFHPVSKKGRNMAPKGLGWIIVDSLDTMILMNQTSRLQHAREWLSTSLNYEQDQDVNTFETTIRMLGGLLAAHYLSTEFPELAPLSDDDPGAPGEDLYLEKARDLGDRLISAFESPSGIPWASINLEQFKGIPSHDDGGASSTAEAATVQLEFKYLAKLTGEKNFWDKVEKVMEVIDGNQAQDGLVPIFLYATNGQFRGQNIRLGSRGDSYYEYLIKQYLQTNQKEPVYLEMWDESLQGVRKHLVTYTETSQFTIIGERPDGLDQALSPKMDHLVCFYPGTIALGVTGGLTEKEARKLPTWSQKKEEEMQLARELMHTCWGTYKYTATGLAAEITHFKIAEPPLPESAPHNPPDAFDEDPDAAWRNDFIVKPADSHNLQRPETVESLLYMWRITGEEKYREWGWEMFKSFMNYTAVEEGGGFTSLSNANVIPPKIKDNMESFWLSETLKYMYLLFSPNDLLPLDKVVINTEGHPLPRFDMGRLFSTGWQRKPRGQHVEVVEKDATKDDA